MTFSAVIDDNLLSGVHGGIMHALWAKANLDPSWATPGASSVQGGNISVAAATGEELSYLAGIHPEQVLSKIQGFRKIFSWGVQEVSAIKPASSTFSFEPSVQFGLRQKVIVN